MSTEAPALSLVTRFTSGVSDRSLQIAAVTPATAADQIRVVLESPTTNSVRDVAFDRRDQAKGEEQELAGVG